MLLVSALLSYSAALRESPTTDEPLHALSGYLIRWMDDYRVDVEDPPLFLWITTLPQQVSDLKVDPNDPAMKAIFANHDDQWSLVIKAMFRTPRTDAGTTPGETVVYSGSAYINRARLIFTLIGTMLGAMIALWAYRIAGSKAALIATALYAFDPNFLAHAPRVKNDVMMAWLMVLLLYAIWRFGRRATVPGVIFIAAICAIGITTKFSAAGFAPILGMGLLCRALLSQPWLSFGRELTSRAQKLLVALGVSIAVAIVCYIAIWASYGFRFSMTSDSRLKFDRHAFVFEAKLNEVMSQSRGRDITAQDIEAHTPSFPIRAILWLDDHHILPDGFLYGLLYMYSTGLARSAFLLGQRSVTGWWYYFPLAMLFKTPLAVLAGALLLSIRGVLRTLRDAAWKRFDWTTFCLWLPIVIYGASAMRMNLNLGIRHILPVYPFIYLIIAVALTKWMASGARIARVVTLVLVIGALVESLSFWPHFIPFFNVACGRATGGARLLGDSNIDWGQDLPLVADWQKDHHDTRLYLSYFGSADPKYYGIQYIQVAGGYAFSDQPVEPKDKPGVLAISVTNIQGIYDTSPEGRVEREYLRQLKPLEILGGSIYLYNWNPSDFDAWRNRTQPRS
jgi:4-amino-4-deoxy-L-arabinose transferase-like glycosyltransferase